jgi:nicotinate-nucleotide adenylyltransferase
LSFDTWQEPRATQPLISARFDPQIDAAEKPFRLGLFGGTFDPIHVGHLHIAERAREQFKLDGVLFIPTGRPVRKPQEAVSKAKDRLAMLLVAVAGNEHFDVSRIEVERKGATYTIDTLRSLKDRYRDKAELFFIGGSDVAADMVTWKGADEISRLAPILCARRMPGQKAEDERPVDGGFDIRYIDSSLIDISSRALREWVKEGRSIHYLVPEATCSYIREQGLYKG